MSAQSTKDLRAGSRDYKRDHDRSHKWSNGVAWGPGRLSTHHPRPAKGPRYPDDAFYAPTPDPRMVRNRSMRADYKETVSDSSASSAGEEDEVSIPAGYGDANEADVAYSFDEPRGPGSGSKVLGYAVEQAVERFENKVTDTLVKDEYLVLDEEGEMVSPANGRAGKSKNIGKKVTGKATSEEFEVDQDEEYEFI